MQEPNEATAIAIAAAPNKSGGFWAALREAVRGSEQDFTEGSIGRAIFLLSVPMVLEMLMESLFGIVNVYWVAHLGKEQAAAVGVTESLLTIVFTVALGLSMGTTALVARRIGEKDREGAARVAEQSILLGGLISIPIGIAGLVLRASFDGMSHRERFTISRPRRPSPPHLTKIIQNYALAVALAMHYV